MKNTDTRNIGNHRSGWNAGTSGNGTIGGLLAGLGGQSGGKGAYVLKLPISGRCVH